MQRARLRSLHLQNDIQLAVLDQDIILRLATAPARLVVNLRTQIPHNMAVADARLLFGTGDQADLTAPKSQRPIQSRRRQRSDKSGLAIAAAHRQTALQNPRLEHGSAKFSFPRQYLKRLALEPPLAYRQFRYVVQDVVCNGHFVASQRQVS